MPLGTGSLLILAGILVALLWHRRLGAGLSLCGLLWVWGWATPVASDRIRLSLKERHGPVAIDELPNADAILLLGGGVEGVAAQRLFPNLTAAADRIWHAARLYHRGKAPILVVTGGRLPWRTDRGLEVDAMLQFLIDLGVPEDKVIAEGNSRNTYENARDPAACWPTGASKSNKCSWSPPPTICDVPKPPFRPQGSGRSRRPRTTRYRRRKP